MDIWIRATRLSRISRRKGCCSHLVGDSPQEVAPPWELLFTTHFHLMILPTYQAITSCGCRGKYSVISNQYQILSYKILVLLSSNVIITVSSQALHYIHYIHHHLPSVQPPPRDQMARRSAGCHHYCCSQAGQSALLLCGSAISEIGRRRQEGRGKGDTCTHLQWRQLLPCDDHPRRGKGKVSNRMNSLLMVQKAYMPLNKWSRFFFLVDRSTRGSTRVSRGPKNETFFKVFILKENSKYRKTGFRFKFLDTELSYCTNSKLCIGAHQTMCYCTIASLHGIEHNWV